MSNKDGNQKTVQKFFSPLDKALQEEQERIDARQQELAKQHGEETAGSDRKLDKIHQHDYSGEAEAKKKNFDQKIYMFPESYNALRRELHGHWQGLFYNVNPDTNTSLAYDMVHNAPQFIGVMNGALDLTVQLDTDNIDSICSTFLNALRKLRGVSPIQ